MKKTILAVTMLMAMATAAVAQTAQQVLEKAVKNINLESGVKANFKMTNALGSTSGTIAVKGTKFHAVTPESIMWFDGKTQWTYMKNNDEVNVANPSATQLQALNPYNFLNLYKDGYKPTMTTADNAYNIHLTATNPTRRVKELFVTVNKKSNMPTQVKVLQGTKWITFDISNIIRQNFDDSTFRFNQKDFPTAEVIDLR
jgi:outer membrane lipoprotein-sorting protein